MTVDLSIGCGSAPGWGRDEVRCDSGPRVRAAPIVPLWPCADCTWETRGIQSIAASPMLLCGSCSAVTPTPENVQEETGMGRPHTARGVCPAGLVEHTYGIRETRKI